LSISPSEVWATLLAFAAFFGLLVLLVVTIVHCARHVERRWVSVLAIVGLIVAPIAGVAVYWFVYAIAASKRHASAPEGIGAN
jgi:cell division protein FtsW (lipid II flippase)